MRFAPLIPAPKPSDTGKRKTSRRPWDHGLPPGIMAKLEVGDVSDPVEREADAIADRIMQMPAPSRDASDVGGSEPETELDGDVEDDELSDAPMVGAFAGAAALPGETGFVARRECAGCGPETEDEEIHRSVADARRCWSRANAAPRAMACSQVALQQDPRPAPERHTRRRTPARARRARGLRPASASLGQRVVGQPQIKWAADGIQRPADFVNRWELRRWHQKPGQCELLQVRVLPKWAEIRQTKSSLASVRMPGA